MQGTVKFYNSQKGYGFISTENVDHFFHISNAVDGMDAIFSEGDAVTFELGIDKNGRDQAVNVRRDI